MTTVTGLDAPTSALGRALGLLHGAASAPELETGWFAHPWDHVRAMLSDDQQRAGLVDAIDALLPVDAERDAGSEARTTRHPLLGEGGLGQVYLVLERDGPSSAAPVTVAVQCQTRPRAGVPSVDARIAVVRATAAGLEPLAATPEHPVRISASVPLDDGLVITTSALLVAPPAQERSALAFELTGLHGPDGPLPPQSFDLDQGGARLAITLVKLVADLLDVDPTSPTGLVAAHLATVLGLDGTLPSLDLGRLVADPGTIRSWLAELASGDRLQTWLGAVAGLLGAAAADPSAATGEPVLLHLVRDEAHRLAVDLRVEVRPAAPDQPPCLVWGVHAALTGADVDAALSLDTNLLVLPLTGHREAVVLETLDVDLVSPAGPGRLHPAAGSEDPDLSVGRLRAGLVWRRAHGQVVPRLELDEVSVRVGGKVSSFARLDLTDASTLTSAAEQLLTDAIEGGLGTGSTLVEGLRTLLGLGTEPGLDLAEFAEDPAAALARYHQALSATPSGWSPLLAAVAHLLGTAAPEVHGTGTDADPWRVAVDAFAAPAGADAALEVLLWSDGAPPERLHVGLGLSLAGSEAWRADARLEVLGAALTAAARPSSWLPAVRVRAQLKPPAASGLGLVVTTTGVEAALDWRVGTTAQASVQIQDLTVLGPTGAVALGTVRLPPADGADAVDLGVGVDPVLLWSACRLLLPELAGSWCGPAASALLRLVGVAADTEDGPPPLLPPDPADLRTLLAQPLLALRHRTASLVRDAATTAPDGTPFVRGLLDLVQAVLTERLPALGSVEALEPDLSTSGSGRPDHPWVVPLQEPDEPALDVLVWAEPDGPPPDWSLAPVADLLSEPDDLDAGSLLAAIDASSADPDLARVLAGLDPGTAGPGLDALADWLGAGDGVVAYEALAGLPEGWRIGEPVAAPHVDLAADPLVAAQVAAEIDARTAGRPAGSWRVLLLAPAVPGPLCWTTLLADVPLGDVGVFSLRVPGVPPGQVDLGPLPGTPYLVVDAGDDGDADADAAVASLARLVDAVTAQPSGPEVLVVAVSYLGQVAAQVAATRPALLGLVTIGSPLSPATPPEELWFAEAVRLSTTLAGSRGGGSTTTLDALAMLASSADAGSVAAGRIPIAAFDRFPAAPALGTVPALALGGLLDEPLVPALAERVLGAAALATAGWEVPDTLAWGVRVGLDLGEPAAEDPEVAVGVTVKLGQVSLLDDDAGRARGAVELHGAVHRPGGWLLDETDGTGTPVRARALALALRATIEPGLPPRARVDLRLVDVACGGETLPWLNADDARGPGLLTQTLARLDASAPSGGRLDALLAALADLGVIDRGGAGGTALRTDAMAELQRDASSYLGARIPALLGRPGGLLGLTAPDGATGGPWVLRSPTRPVELAVRSAPWRVRVDTVDGGLPLGAGATLTATGEVQLDQNAAVVTGALGLGALSVTRGTDGGLQLDAPGWDTPVVLPPAAQDVGPLAARLARLLGEGALTALAERALGGTVRLTGLGRIVADPVGWVASSLGDGVLPRAEDLRALLRLVAEAARLEHDDARPLVLPGGLVLDVAQAGERLRLSVSAEHLALPGADATAPTLSLDLGLELDRGRTVTPAGRLTLGLPLPGGWDAVDLTFSAAGSGLGVSATLATTPPVVVELLPAAHGLGQLVGAGAQQLLPTVLDALDAALANRTPPSPVRGDVVAVAAALGVYDDSATPGHGFAARAAALANLEAALAAGDLSALGPGVATAAGALLTRFGVPMAAHPPPGTVSVVVPEVVGGSLTATLDLSHAPALGLSLAEMQLGALVAGLDLTASAASFGAGLALGGSWDTGAGVVLTPQLRAAYEAGTLAVTLRPLGTDDVTIELAPQPEPPTADDLGRLAEAWLVPLAVTLGLRGADPVLAWSLWPGGPTVLELLRAAGLATGSLDQPTCAMPPPTPPQVAAGVLHTLADHDIPLPGGLTGRVLRAGDRFGLGVAGALELPAGDVRAAVLFGVPATEDPGWGSTGSAVGVLLLDLADPAVPAISPGVLLGGLGVRVRGATEGKPLVTTQLLTLDAASVHLRTEIPLSGAHVLQPDAFDGAVRLDGIGLPLLGAIGSGGDDPDPVIGALLKPGPGDTSAANPPLDLAVASVDGKIHVRIDDRDDAGPHWVGVHRTFGPLHLEQIGFGHAAATTGPGAVDVHVDASVSVSGLLIDPSGLRLSIPLERPADPARWAVGLDGLAVRLDLPVVHVAGGLLKVVDDHGQVEYDGFASVEVAGRSFTAIGAFSQPHDQQGSYTSLFVFVSLPFTLGGPPFLFVEGLAGGVGFNRGLVVPTNPLDAVSFPLVQAVEQGGLGSGAESPMATLERFGSAVPARRGSYWVSAGLRFSSFAVLHTTAIVYAALDRGFEVGVLGVTRLVLPLEGPRLLNVELALNARYSTRDRLLSVRAQLTDNSWVLSPDCQLTGGFAFMVWFGTGRFLFTIGGYAPPKDFDATGLPVVPRVGFRWAVSATVSVKGETYFALTPSCLMFGARLEVAFSAGPVSVWFAAWFDVLLGWDPFQYKVSVGVTIGASFDLQVCFIVCVRIKVSVTLGASVEISGPPLHGYAHVDLAVASVTVPIGTQPSPSRDLSWSGSRSFVARYLTADGSSPAGSAQVAGGAVADAGSGQGDGTSEHPWLVSPTWRLHTETKLPCSAASLGGTPVTLTAADGSARVALPGTPLHPLPCGAAVGLVRATHVVEIARVGADGSVNGLALPTELAEPVQGHFASTLWLAPGRGVDSLPALGGLDLRFVAEPGAPSAEISLVGLVESAVTPLPAFLPPRTAGEAPSVARLVAPTDPTHETDAVPTDTPRTDDAPRLRAAVHRSTGWRADPSTSPAPRRALARRTPDTVPVDRWHVWDLPTGWDGELALDVEDGHEMRLTCLGIGGSVLVDQVLTGTTTASSPPGTARVTSLLTRRRQAYPGWQLGSRLLLVDRCTALAQDAALVLPGPVTPGPHRPRPLQLATAADLLRGWSSCTTVLPAATSRVAVLLDPADHEGGPADERPADGAADPETDVLVTVDGEPVRLELDDGELAASVPVPPGSRLLRLVLPPAAREDRRRVMVDAGDRWRLAGVLGIDDASVALGSAALSARSATVPPTTSSSTSTLRWVVGETAEVLA